MVEKFDTVDFLVRIILFVAFFSVIAGNVAAMNQSLTGVVLALGGLISLFVMVGMIKNLSRVSLLR